MRRVLIVDDDERIRHTLSEVLKKSDFAPSEAQNGLQALEILKRERFDLILLDVIMPEMNGIETLREMRKTDSDAPVIVLTGHADIATAVEAIKLGAYDFLTKPPQLSKLILTIRRATEVSELQKSVKQLNTSMETSLEWVFGKSASIKNIIKQIRQVAWTDFSVIIQGETGTGKSVAAQSIHNLSKRAEQPFQIVDAGVIPETLMESELFGHERGAFTGADKKKRGFFESANRGTIFIDELENMPQNMQAKLLRAVEEKKVYSLGSTKPIDIDVRIITATNADIKESVRQKRFREDLYYRLSEFIIILPPLKERVEDIPFLVNKFLAEASIELGKQTREMDEAALEILKRYHWPGNVRELKNVVRRAVLLSNDGAIGPEHLEFLVHDGRGDKDALPFLPLKEVSSVAAKDAEKQAIGRALDLTKGNKTKAATMLDVDYKTLLTKIKEYNIS